MSTFSSDVQFLENAVELVVVVEGQCRVYGDELLVERVQGTGFLHPFD